MPYDVGEAEVIDEAEVADGPIIAEDEGILEEDLLDEGEDKGTGAKDVDIHAYSPEAQIIAGKVAEVHVSVRVDQEATDKYTFHMIGGPTFTTPMIPLNPPFSPKPFTIRLLKLPRIWITQWPNNSSCCSRNGHVTRLKA